MEREGALGFDRRDVDQGATALSCEVWQRGHRPVYLSHEVHVYDSLELLWSRLLESSEESYRSEVHPGIEPPVLLHGTVDYCLHLFEIRGVCDHGRRFAALAAYLFSEGVEPFFAAGGDDHLGASFSEPEGSLPPYAAGGSHQGYYLLLHGLEMYGRHR